jgi:hypothetical protein
MHDVYHLRSMDIGSSTDPCDDAIVSVNEEWKTPVIVM